jgi:hypothetical protein
MNLRVGEMLLFDELERTWHKYYGNRSVSSLRLLLSRRRVERRPVQIYLQSCLKRHLYHRLDVTPDGVEYHVRPVTVADSEIRGDPISEAARVLGRRSSDRKAATSRNNGRRRWIGA